MRTNTVRCLASGWRMSLNVLITVIIIFIFGHRSPGCNFRRYIPNNNKTCCVIYVAERSSHGATIKACALCTYTQTHMYNVFVYIYIVMFCMYIVYGHRIRVTGPLKLFLFPHQGGGVSMNVWSGSILWRGGGEGARGYFTKRRCAWLYRPNYSGTIQTDNDGRISVRRPIRPVNGMENWARGKKTYIYIDEIRVENEMPPRPPPILHLRAFSRLVFLFVEFSLSASRGLKTNNAVNREGSSLSLSLLPAL